MQSKWKAENGHLASGGGLHLAVRRDGQDCSVCGEPIIAGAVGQKYHTGKCARTAKNLKERKRLAFGKA